MTKIIWHLIKLICSSSFGFGIAYFGKHNPYVFLLFIPFSIIFGALLFFENKLKNNGTF